MKTVQYLQTAFGPMLVTKVAKLLGVKRLRYQALPYKKRTLRRGKLKTRWAAARVLHISHRLKLMRILDQMWRRGEIP